MVFNRQVARVKNVQKWNRQRIQQPNLKVDLRIANLRGASLHRVDLHALDLRGADLSQADLSKANLDGANLAEAKVFGTNFFKASLCGANLDGVDLRGVNLRGANLSGANLYQANLSRVNLINLNLSRANLSGADLSGTQVLGTNFSGAVFTAACLENWNINGETIFQGTVCDYVYLKRNQQERRPRSDTFKPGEFATLFKKALDTIDLIFKDGIDWQAFFSSFQELRQKYQEENLAIQAIERKSGNAFVIRLEVPSEADKSVIEAQAKEFYQTQLVLIEQRYRAELQAKDSAINAYKHQSANLMKITELLASKPMTVEFSQNFNAPVGNVVGVNEGTVIANLNQAEDAAKFLTSTEVATLLNQFKELLQQSDLPSSEKEKVVRSIEAAKDEVQIEEPDKEFAAKSLQRATKVLKEAGETVEAGTTLWQKLQPILETISPWLGVATNFFI